MQNGTGNVGMLAGIEALALAANGSVGNIYGGSFASVNRKAISGNNIGVYGMAQTGGSGSDTITVANLIGVQGDPSFYASDTSSVTVAWETGLQARAGYLNTNGGSATAVATNAAGLRIIDGSVTGTGASITNQYGIYIEDITKGTNKYAIYSVGGTNYFGGNVGIGTTSPSANLSVNGVSNVIGGGTAGNATVNSLSMGTDPSTYISWLQSYGASATNLLLNPLGGNIGIGTTAPSTLLQLGTAGTTAGVLSLAGATSGLVTLDVAAAAGTYAFTLPTSAGTNTYVLQTDGSGNTSWVNPTSLGTNYWTDGGSYLYSTNSESVRVYNGADYVDLSNDTTDAIITLSGLASLRPLVDDTYSLGTSSFRWSDLFLGPGSLYIGTSATAQATINYLDTTQDVLQVSTDATGNADISFFTDDLYLDKSAGYVGIGTTAPGSALDVKGTLRLSGATSGYVGFAPAAAAGSTTYTWPTAPTNTYVLQTDGSGNLSWVAQSGGTSYWSRTAPYLYPTTLGDAIRIGTNQTTDYIEIDHDGTDAILSFAGTTALNINIGVIDLSNQTVDITLNNAADALNFDSNTLSIDALNNRVGIGVTDSDVKLEVMSTTQQLKLSYDSNSFASFTVVDGSDLTIKPGENVGQVFIQPAADNGTSFFQVLDADGGNPILNVDSTNERVGIGTASPSYKLDIADSTANGRGINIAQTGATGTNYGIYSAVSGAATTNYGAYLNASGGTANTQLRLANTTTYNVDFSINTTTHDLTVKPSDNDTDIIFQPTSDSFTSFFQVLDADGGNPIFNVDSTNERVGIGTSSPDEKLHVYGGNLTVDNLTSPQPNGSTNNAAGSVSGANAIYYYKLVANNSLGAASASTERSVTLTPISVPAQPTVTVYGTPETTTYTYKVTATTANGETTASTTRQITNGNDALDGTDYNEISWSTVTGATGYNIYRQVGAGLWYKTTGVTSPYNDQTTTWATQTSSPGSNTARTDTNTNTLTWNAVEGATSYRLYRGTTSGGENVYYYVDPATYCTPNCSYPDIGAAATGGTPPTTNATGGDGNFDGSVTIGGENAVTTDALSVTANLLTTGNGISVVANNLTNGSMIDLYSSGTSALTNQKGLNILLTAANGTTGQTTYGIYSSNIHSGSGTNIAGYFNASGGANNYGLIVANGSVGVGTTAPGKLLEVSGAANQLRLRMDGTQYTDLGTNNGFFDINSYERRFRLTSGTTNTKWTEFSTNTNGYLYINPQGSAADVPGNGRVGIGTSTPERPLEVTTNFNTPDEGMPPLRVTNNYGTGEQWIEFRPYHSPSTKANIKTNANSFQLSNNDTDSDPTTQYTDLSTNTSGYFDITPYGLRTGINTSTPNRALEVHSDFSWADGSNPQIRVSHWMGTATSWVDIQASNSAGTLFGNISTVSNLLGIDFPDGTRPRRPLDVYNASVPQLRLTYTDNTYYVDFQATSSGNLYINPSGGNVGIGDFTPDSILDLSSASASGTQLSITNTNSGYDPLIGLQVADGTNTFTLGVDNSDADKFKIGTSAIDTDTRLTIDSAGDIGIGTTSPSYKLDIADSGAIPVDNYRTLNVSNTQTSSTAYVDVYGGYFAVSGANSGTAATSTGIYASATGASTTNYGIYSNVANGTNNYAAILMGGNVGIGTAAPTNILSFSGQSAQTIWTERNTTGNTPGNNLTFRVGGATSGATNKNGGDLYVSGGTSTGTGSSNIYFQTATAGASGTGDNAPSTKMTILGSGNVGIGTATPSSFMLQVAGNVGPNADNTYDLGSTSLRWKTLHVGPGSVVVHNDATDTLKVTLGFSGSTAQLAANSTTPLQITTGANTGLNIDTAGEVGIGTTAPGATLQVHLSTAATNTINSLLISRWTRPQTPTVKYGNSFDILLGSYSDSTINSTSRVDFKLANGATDLPDTTVMTLQGNGNVGIGTTTPSSFMLQVAGNIGPDADNTYDLGSTSLRWKTLHVGPGSVVVHNDATNTLKVTLGFSGSTAQLVTNSTTPLQITTGANTGLNIDTAGEVGINTSSPATTLDVNGVINAATGYRVANAAASGNYLRGNGTNFVSSAIQSSDVSSFAFIQNGNSFGGLATLGTNDSNALAFETAGTEKVRIDTSGNVGIGTTPGSKLDVKGTLRLSGATSGYVGLSPAAAAGSTTYTLPIADGTSGQVLSTDGSATLSWADGNYMQGSTDTLTLGLNWYYLKPYWNGSVWLGGSSLYYAGAYLQNMYVASGIYLTSYGGGMGLVGNFIPNGSYALGSASYYWNNAYLNNVYFGSGLQLYSYGGGVGLTSNFLPTGSYTIGSATNWWNGVYGSSFYINGFTSGSVLFTGTSNLITQDNTNFYWDNTNDRLGIGTNSPSYDLELSADSAAKPSTNTWTIASDKRIKTDIREFTDGLNILSQINPILYQYNGLAGFAADGKDYIGVIAQDIQAVAPYTVNSYMAKLNPDDTEETELLNFNSHALTFVLINSVKELNDKMLINQSTIDQIGTLDNPAETISDTIKRHEENISYLNDMMLNFMGEVTVTEGNVYINKLTVTTAAEIDGKLTVKGNVAFNKDTVGQAKILACKDLDKTKCATSVHVTFETEYEYQPVVTITNVGKHKIQYQYVDNITTSGFDIVIDPTQDTDVLFDWHAFGSDEGKIFISDGSTENIEIVTDGSVVFP